MRRECVVAEDVIVHCYQTIGQRRLLQIPYAVDVKRYPVATCSDMLGRIGVGAISVIQEGRRKKRGKMHGEKDKQEQGPGLYRG